ncbi:hypothetical protein BO94DRAFT_577968 [Aspergillus sclerotioniger CBS 115572]|uniref:Aminoglycoside phosphotransferase domain-containing protein n=1 Tax=Aspergillus sclerotioniger CBS 115572 TaxID=1450535 RepID=A0A317VQS1_9EURO|nr:hypothetical protein BO94DRAFT_577968 [Aspergillus sclerotioniger CBS 115572]PWY75242.1 hypothetical protein BO94DRAFT_577968 [Aspergillus sclerotioniger CBS 115572]
MTPYNESCLFDPKWLTQTINFKNPSSSWVITQKIQEHETLFSADEYLSSGFYSESTCISTCQEIGSSNQAIMKIRMQVPNSPDDASSSASFIQPPEREICGRTLLEIKALETMTAAKCSCIPKYITSKHENRGSNGWVSGGFVDYIVMEKVEGVTVSERYVDGLQVEEQDELRKAFRLSYLECQDLGFVHLDQNLTNLIWDKRNMKCYIVDWEAWGGKAYEWSDNEYYRWGLL